MTFIMRSYVAPPSAATAAGAMPHTHDAIPAAPPLLLLLLLLQQ
jgi:hypothetical protein